MIPESQMQVTDLSPVVQVGLPWPKARLAALQRSLPDPVLCLMEWDEDPEVCFEAANAMYKASRPTFGDRPDGYGRDLRPFFHGVMEGRYWRLAADPRHETHEEFRNNPELIPYQRLCQSPLWSDEEFRKRVAARHLPSIGQPALLALSSDASPDVRLILARNDTLNEPLLHKLITDHSREVSETARAAFNRRVQKIRDDAPYLDAAAPRGWSLAIHDLLRSKPMTRDALLDQVARASVTLPNARLLKQPWVPAATLRHLAAAYSHHESVRGAVAANPNTPAETLKRLAFGEGGHEAAIDALSNPGLDMNTILSFTTGRLRNTLDRRKLEAIWSNPSIPEALIQSSPGGTAVNLGIAKNTAAPGIVLSKLASVDDIDVRCMVAQNRSAPSSVLVELARASEQDIQFYIGESLLGNPSLPKEAVEILLTHTSMRIKVAFSIHAPSNILVQLTTDSDPAVRNAAGRNPATPESAVLKLINDEAVQSLYKWGNIQYFRAQAVIEHAESTREAEPLPRPDSPSEAAAVFLLSMDARSRQAICGHASLEIDFIHRVLAKDPNTEVRRNLALFGDDSIRRLILETEQSDEVLDSLASATNDPELAASMLHIQGAKSGLIHNAICPPHVLESVARNSSTRERELLAQHPSAGEGLLDWLSSAPVSSQRMSALVAQHPNCSTQTLARLAEHPAAEVRQYVAASSRRPSSDRVLARLAGDKDVLVRSIVAMNRNTSVATLERLASDDSPEVRQLLACNRRSSVRTWALLADDCDAKVRLLARSLLTPTSEVRQKLASSTGTSQTTLHVLAEDAELGVRMAVAVNSSAGPNTVEKLSQDSEPRIRTLVAKRIDVPSEVIHRLLQDPNWGVRRAAKSAQRRFRKMPR